MIERSPIQYLYILICFIYTKVNFFNARLIRLPIDIRNRRGINFGKGLTTGKVYISDTSHGNYNGEYHSNPLVEPNKRELISKEVIIGDNVWIGEGVCILPGVKIGEGSIIGANSVVTRNIDSYSIAVGSPAKEIKKFNFSEKKWQKY